VVKEKQEGKKEVFMKSKYFRKWTAVILAGIMITTGLAACGNSGDGTTDASSTVNTGSSEDTGAADAGTARDDKPDTWIADRKIVVQAYVDDIGYSMPDNVSNTLVMQELKRRTGIELDIRYTPGDDDASVMASQLASGTVPDAIISYLDDSTRPEFPLIIKAAREEMFADLSPYIADTKVYSKYLEEGYLKNETYTKIFMRDEFNGAVYLMSLAVDRVDRSQEWIPESEYVGGMYIQKAIADDLGIDPSSINTQEQLYDLLVAIKEGGYKDANGNDVYPLGPKYWGGSVDSMGFILRGYDWVSSYGGYNMTADGEILHEVETDYAMEKVMYVRKLLAEGLINPEFFTMDGTRAEEVSRTRNSAIMADVHNYQDIVFETGEWVPLGPLNDFLGNNASIVTGKSTHGVWAVSADAENPEEILAFFDYIATTEGQLLTNYGIEGVNYTMENGYPILTDETLEHLDNGDEDYLVDTVGASFGNSGFILWSFLHTDVDSLNDFGESRPGSSLSDTFANAIKIAENNPREKRLLEGLKATAYLTASELASVKVQMDLLNYQDTLVQAMYASSEAQAQQILDSFKAQLDAAGLADFKEYLYQLYEEDPKSLAFEWE